MKKIILICVIYLFILLANNCFAASLLKHTVRPSGSSPAGDFTTLAAAIAHLQASHSNLVSADVYAEISIEDNGHAWAEGDDTTSVTIDSITTDATRYLHIYATGNARHAGKWSWVKYALKLSDENGISFSSDIGYIRIDGLQVTLEDSSPPTNDYLFNMSDSANPCDVRISNCIAYGIDDDYRANVYGFAITMSGTPAGTVKIWNCIANNFRGGTTCRGFSATVSGTGNALYYWNCTAFDNHYGFYSPGTSTTAINCIANSCTDGFNGTFNSSSNYNASDIASDAPGANSRNGTNGDATFVDEAACPWDLHLSTSDSNAKGQGTDNSSAGYTTDIDMETISGSWCIGVDWITSGVSEDYYSGRGIGRGIGRGVLR